MRTVILSTTAAIAPAATAIPPTTAVILGLDPRIYCRRQARATVPAHPQPLEDPRLKAEDDAERVRRLLTL